MFVIRVGTFVTRARHCVRILGELTSAVRFYFSMTDTCTCTIMLSHVRVGGGAINSMVDDACTPRGVAVTLGNASTTGSLMGGGVGFLARWIGLR